MDQKRIRCFSNTSQHVLIYLQPFPSNPTRKFKKFAILAHILHILASPRNAPGTIAVNVTWMERGFNAGQTHRSMYPSIFNRFPVIQPVSSKVPHFITFLAHFGLPGTIAVKVTWMERGFNACKMPRCMYPSIFNQPQGWPRLNFAKILNLDTHKTIVWWRKHDNMFSRFDTIPACVTDRQTDGRTDVQPIAIGWTSVWRT